MTTDELLRLTLCEAPEALNAAAADLSIACAVASRTYPALAADTAILADAVEAEIRALGAVASRLD